MNAGDRLQLKENNSNMMKSSKLIKISTFHQNKFLTCYLIFNFRPTYFSYFRKITGNYNSHNVKKTGGSKTNHPRSQGVKPTLPEYLYTISKIIILQFFISKIIILQFFIQDGVKSRCLVIGRSMEM